MKPSQAQFAPPAASTADLYRSVWPRLVKFAVLVAGSRGDGEDLAQDAFIGLMRAGQVDNPEAYLRRSVVNAAINRGRRSTREREYQRSLREEVSLPPEIDEMWRLVRSLPPRQRAALVLRYELDLSEREIAHLLGCRPGTVKSLTARALSHLREEMNR